MKVYSIPTHPFFSNLNQVLHNYELNIVIQSLYYTYIYMQQMCSISIWFILLFYYITLMFEKNSLKTILSNEDSNIIIFLHINIHIHYS